MSMQIGRGYMECIVHYDVCVDTVNALQNFERRRENA